MAIRKTHPGRVRGARLPLVVLLVAGLILGACGQDTEVSPPTTGPIDDATEGFTFLGLGKTSRYSDNLREKLRQRLGHDVAESKMPLSLAIHPPGFMESQLPGIARLNGRLNYAPRERIEHNILRLAYRYAHKKGTPFKRVELVFSRYTDKPLLFYVKSDKAGGEMLASIKAKYGQYKKVADEARELTTLVWNQSPDVLAVTIGTDRFGDPEYEIWIFYGANLEELAATEEKQRRVRRDNLNEVGKKAF